MNKYEQCEKIFFRLIFAFVHFCSFLLILNFFLFQMNACVCSFFDFKSCINNYISDIYLSKSFAVPAFLLSFSYNLFR